MVLVAACRYPTTGSPAVLIHSDGSANVTWPEGSMAATLDPEEPPVAGSIASTSSSSPGAPAPIKGYRLLAMYRTITGVAASFDSTGGFVQWPNGQLMLVWNRKDGTAYGPDGRVTHTFNNRRWATAHCAHCQGQCAAVSCQAAEPGLCTSSVWLGSGLCGLLLHVSQQPVGTVPAACSAPAGTFGASEASKLSLMQLGT